MRFSRQVLFPMAFLLLAVAVVFGAVWQISRAWGSGPTRYTARPTNPPPQPGTPIAPLEQVNPALMTAFDLYQTGYTDDEMIVANVQPIGAYLPRSGNRQAALADPTAAPTQFPYPTTPPQPTLGQPPITAQANCAPTDNPVAGVLTQGFHRYHLGIDLGVQAGTPVRATHSGQVIFADWNENGYGYLVILQSGPFITYYAHNTSVNVREGQQVIKDSVIAWSGSTGNSNGPHVHYETRINDVLVDPLTFADRGYATC